MLLPHWAVALILVENAGAVSLAQSRLPQGAPGLQIGLTDGVAALPQPADADTDRVDQLVKEVVGQFRGFLVPALAVVPPGDEDHRQIV